MAISHHFGSSSSADHDNEDTEVYGTKLDTNNARALTRSTDIWDCFVCYIVSLSSINSISRDKSPVCQCPGTSVSIMPIVHGPHSLSAAP